MVHRQGAGGLFTSCFAGRPAHTHVHRERVLRTRTKKLEGSLPAASDHVTWSKKVTFPGSVLANVELKLGTK